MEVGVVCIDRQMQLLPPTTETKSRRQRRLTVDVSDCPDRLPGIDQMLSAREVERITGRHRCTIYRWVWAGTFSQQRAGGGRGWLRSDVERWLNGGGSCKDS